MFLEIGLETSTAVLAYPGHRSKQDPLEQVDPGDTNQKRQENNELLIEY